MKKKLRKLYFPESKYVDLVTIPYISYYSSNVVYAKVGVKTNIR